MLFDNAKKVETVSKIFISFVLGEGGKKCTFKHDDE